MSLDNKTLELRLITKDSVIGQSSSLSRVANKLQPLRHADKATLKDLEGFIRELMHYRLELNKSCRLLQAFEVHNREYDGMENQVKEKIQQAKDDLQSLETALIHAQEIRKHRLQCERVASEVNQHESTSLLKRKISDLQENLQDTNDTLLAIETEISNKRQQFDLLMNSLDVIDGKIVDIAAEDDKNTVSDHSNNGGLLMMLDEEEEHGEEGEGHMEDDGQNDGNNEEIMAATGGEGEGNGDTSASTEEASAAE